MLLTICSNFRPLNGDLKERMRSWRNSIHVCRSHGSIFHSNLHHIVDLLYTLDCEIGKITNIHAWVWLFMKVKSIPWIFWEKISNLLIVNLEITRSNKELRLLWVSLDSLKHIFEGPWHDSFLNWVVLLSSHSMGLTSSCLTIGKDGSIVAFEDVLDDATCAPCIDKLLRESPVETHIESELLWRLVWLWLVDHNFSRVTVHFDYNFMACCHFIFGKRSASNHDFHSFLFLGFFSYQLFHVRHIWISWWGLLFI